MVSRNFLLLLLVPAVFGEWAALRTTWSLNPFNKWAFDKMPRDMSFDDMKGFTLKDNACAGQSNFLGRRYQMGNDLAVILLFDVNGYIAGMQTSYPKSKSTPSNTNMNHPVISDGDNWTLTVYFVDPSIICTTGRTPAEYAQEGTGYGLWIQNGTNPHTDTLHIPLDETAIQTTKWTDGHCFISMGEHYWYNIQQDMSCDDFFPFFVLYNNGVLNAFGFALNADLVSNRYEHPSKSIKLFMKPVPDCFYTDPNFVNLSTMHVYFTDWPRSQTC